jgi:hypothetical protein
MAAESLNSENIFDSHSLHSDATCDIATLMMICGMDISGISLITIDEIIEKIRDSYPYALSESITLAVSDDELTLYSPYSRWLRVENLSLVRRLRRAWFNMEFAREVELNGE